MRHIAVPLIGPQMPRPRPKRLSPQHSLAPVAIMAEPERLADRRHMLRHHGAIPAVSVAGQDQPFAADGFRAAIGQGHRHTSDAASLMMQHRRAPLADDVDAFRLAGLAQPVHQFRP